MIKSTGRRSADDIEWKNVKEDVRKRDGGMCILCRILTREEYKKFINSNPAYINIIDPAHYESVSGHIEGLYDADNIYSLCRAMHQRLDSMEDPVTGKHINKEEHDKWWDRIIKGAKELNEKNPFTHPDMLKV